MIHYFQLLKKHIKNGGSEQKKGLQFSHIELLNIPRVTL